MTFSEAAAAFEASSLPLMKPASQVTMKSHLVRLRGAFGEKSVYALNARVIQEFFIAQSRTHAPKSIKNIWGTMRLVLSVAVAEGNLEKLPNPRLPKVGRVQQEWLTVQQMKDILWAARKNPETYLLIYLACETGMRIGEILGLQWQDIDFAEKTLSIRRSVYKNAPQTPKTDAAFRTICISDALCVLLGGVRKTDGYVLGGGKPLSARTATDRLYALLKRMGCPQTGFHAIRRGNITFLGNAGCPEPILAQRVGHRLKGLTFGLYAQRTELADRVWVEKISGLIL